MTWAYPWTKGRTYASWLSRNEWISIAGLELGFTKEKKVSKLIKIQKGHFTASIYNEI